MRRIHSIILVISAFVLASSSYAQVYKASTPISWLEPTSLSTEVYTYTLAPIDLVSLQTEDAINDMRKDIPWRFGKEIDLSLDMYANATTDILSDGRVVRRLKIVGAGANSLNVVFDLFELAEGSELFLYGAGGSDLQGPYTIQNNNPDNNLGTWLVTGDVMTIELNEPAEVAGASKLHLNKVTHGYRGIGSFARALGDSGPCNKNVICPEGDKFRDQIKSVALIITGAALCSGSLINNSASDGVPYFLTAEHCLDGSVSTWSFRFNWESGDCLTNSPTPAANVMNGATLKASSASTDFALLQLTNAVPPSYDLYWLGWCKDDVAPPSVACIHHPNGDNKKISNDASSPSKASYNSADCWRISDWDSGTTEGGSSGSPLLDNDGRVIGQLFGGTAACSGATNNGNPDFFGRFGKSWTGDGSASSRLMDWLDPLAENPDCIDGYPREPWDLSIFDVRYADDKMCVDQLQPEVIYKNSGNNAIHHLRVNWQYDNGAVASVKLKDTLQPGEKGNFYLYPFNATPGSHSVRIYTSLPNDSLDDNRKNDTTDLTVLTGGYGREVNVDIETDNLGAQTTWEIKDGTGTVVASGGPYSNVVGGEDIYSFQCLNGCYTFYIYDAGANGICCGSGSGSWEVSDEWGSTLGSGATFGAKDSVSFCADPLGIRKINVRTNDLKVYPNPSAGEFTVNFDQSQNPRVVEVYSMPGALVYHTLLDKVQSGTAIIRLDDQPAGLYLLVVESDAGRSSKLLQVIR